jgi:hypothetical protein
VQHVLRHAGAAVGDGNDDVFAAVACGDGDRPRGPAISLNGRPVGIGVAARVNGGGVAQGVANDVAQRAGQQIGFRERGKVARHVHDHPAAFLGFARHHPAGQFGQRNRFQLHVFAADAGLREGEQFVDEFRHMAQFLADIGHIIPLLFVGALVENAEGHFHARERRTEFVGDIAEETLLAGKKFAQPGGHVIERAAQPAQFVGPRGLDPCFEAALGDGFSRAGHLPESPRHAPDQRHPEQHRDRQDHAAADEPGAVIEKKSAAAQ